MSVVVCEYCSAFFDLDFEENCTSCEHPYHENTEGCYDTWELDYECLDLECDCPANLGITYADLKRVQNGEIKYNELRKMYKKKKLNALIDAFYI